jgi:hypothetical protein
LQPADRPPIDVSFVLDISGRQAPFLSVRALQHALVHCHSHHRKPPLKFVIRSMGSGFPDDPDRRTKLDVAKDCLLHVSKQLGPRDRLSVITFNTATKTVLPTDYCTPRHVKKQVFPGSLSCSPTYLQVYRCLF